MEKKFNEFGDCEIRTIAFDEPNVFIKLFDSTKGEFYALIFSEISLMRISCEHWQVVLDRLIVYENIAEAKADKFAIKFCGDMGVDMNDPKLANRKISILSGIAGGDAFIASAGVEQKENW